MHILFYASKEFSLPRKLFQAIQQAGLSEVELEHLSRSGALRERLRRPGPEPALVILSPADHRELHELAGMRNIFADRKVILIVPDEDEATIALAHRLRPRYLCHIDDHADRIGEVAWNILRRGGAAGSS